MIPLLSKGSLQLLSIAKCLATIGKENILDTFDLNIISHYFPTQLFNFQRSSSLAVAKCKAHLPSPPSP